MSRRFVMESLVEIVAWLRERLEASSAEQEIVFEVSDPDLGVGLYAGERLVFAGEERIHRSFRVWMELAEQLQCRLMTPRPLEQGWVRLRLCPLQATRSWHAQAAPSGEREKYGIDSGFFRLQKLEEPSFLIEYMDCLQKLSLPEDAEILDLGVNTGDEFAAFSALFSEAQRSRMQFVGVDHATSAIEVARQRFPHENMTWLDADINELASLGLGRFDLIISIATLHSPALRSREIFHRLVQEHLKPTGHILLGFPNGRYLDHELRYGAQVKNYTRPELSLMLREVAYHKRYLQQHRFRVTVTGKHMVFVTGVRLPTKAKQGDGHGRDAKLS